MTSYSLTASDRMRQMPKTGDEKMNATNAPKKLTTEEIDRMCYLSAYGDSLFDPIDDNLKAKKWVNILFYDDGEKYTEISNSAIFAAFDISVYFSPSSWNKMLTQIAEKRGQGQLEKWRENIPQSLYNQLKEVV